MKKLIFKNLRQYSAAINPIVKRFTHSDLKKQLATKIPGERIRITNIIRQRKKLGETDLSTRVYNGLHGYNDSVWDTSQIDDHHGLVFRGYSLPELLDKLPKLPGDTIPPVEGHFWLLMTGTIPNKEQLTNIQNDWTQRAQIPFYIEKLIRDSTSDTTPIQQICAAIDLLKSSFVEAYRNGIFKDKYWEMVLDDMIDLLAKVPTIVAMVYNKLYKRKTFLPMHNTHLDWASNFCNKLGYRDKTFHDYIRLFLLIYSDLNDKYSNDSDCLKGTAFSNPYKNYTNSLDSLASINTRFKANEFLEFLKQVQEQVGPDPQNKIIKEYLNEYYKNAPIPGFDNIEFKTDPRLECIIKFIKSKNITSPLIQLSQQLCTVLQDENCHPTVDTLSGVLLDHFGLKEVDFYVVLYALARSLGLLSTYIWDRVLGIPLEKSKTAQTISEKRVDKIVVPFQCCADIIRSQKITLTPSKISNSSQCPPLNVHKLQSNDDASLKYSTEHLSSDSLHLFSQNTFIAGCKQSKTSKCYYSDESKTNKRENNIGDTLKGDDPN